MTTPVPAAECPTPCDEDCELRPGGCHESHLPAYKRGHQPHGCDDIRLAIDAAVAAERERWRAALAEHYLMTVNCDHDTGSDNPVCGCSVVNLGWHPSVGAAIQAWIDHVTEQAMPAVPAEGTTP